MYDTTPCMFQSRMTGSQSEDNFDAALRAHQENGQAGAAAAAASAPDTEEKKPAPL